tara:strand:+ start:328 stop:456 length:129 start_codon:yes stop_codon:yes gene_type:complete
MKSLFPWKEGPFLIWGYLFTQKNLQKEGCFSEEESMVDFIII